MNLGENIRKARKAAGVSQSELAERLQVHQKDISRWENGAHAPTIEMFAKICRELNASVGCNIELDVIEDATPSVSQHTGETTVYVDRSNKKYHSKPNCSGMKNPKSIPLSQAKKKYTACKKCCK